MRLTDLKPRWITGKRSDAPEADGKRGDVGMTFLCPCCKETRLGVLFDPPIDEGVLWLWATWPPLDGLRWARDGDAFENITLTPSVDASKFGHWHGSITNGEVK